jgi:hypothetical protein
MRRHEGEGEMNPSKPLPDDSLKTGSGYAGYSPATAMIGQCKEWVRQATDSPQRALYEVLADYYAELATDFQKVIEKRKVA